MKQPKKLFMESTQIAPAKTAAEIIQALVNAGASQIASSYDQGRLTGITFVLKVQGHDAPFSLPSRVDPVFRLIQSRRKSYDRQNYAAKDREQAERVAWRQLLRWVQAQLAMIETGMVQVDEVFLPYMITRTGQTVFEMYQTNGPKMLAAGD